MKQMVQYPQAVWNGKETIPGGGLPYPQFWLSGDRPKFHPGPTPLLYEAQQSPLYYWLMLPVFNAAGGTDHLANSVSVLRLVNVGFRRGRAGGDSGVGGTGLPPASICNGHRPLGRIASVAFVELHARCE